MTMNTWYSVTLYSWSLLQLNVAIALVYIRLFVLWEVYDGAPNASILYLMYTIYNRTINYYVCMQPFLHLIKFVDSAFFIWNMLLITKK